MPVTVVDFRDAKNIPQLAAKIGCDETLIYELLNSENPKEFYHQLSLPKKNKKRSEEVRTVWQAATAELANAQKSLLKKYEDFALVFDKKYPHSNCHGFVSGRSIASNARVHLGQRFLLRADIENFFESITTQMLVQYFCSIGLHEKVAEGITALTTVNGYLAQGVNTSPLFANLICVELDDALVEMSHKFNCRYSRYADDLSFSSVNNLFLIKEEIENHLSSVLNEYQFKLSKTKFRISKNGQAHFVTGLSISDPDAPHVPKKFKSKIRQELYYIKKYGIQKHAEAAGYSGIDHCLNNIDGRICYIKSIEPELGSQLRILWHSLLNKERLWPDNQYANRKIYYPRFGYCYIDESEFELEDGVKALALALVFTDNPEQVKERINDLIETLTVDDYSTVDRKRLCKQGLHFTKDHPDMRSDIVRQMSKMPIQCYVAFQRLDNERSQYLEIYLRLFEELLQMRMSSKNRYIYNITVEESSSSVEKGLVETYENLVNVFEKNGRLIVVNSNLQIVGKLDELCLSMADYFLGVIKHYYEIPEGSKIGRHLGKVKHFERLRNKIRLIYDVDSNICYWRKNPLVRTKK